MLVPITPDDPASEPNLTAWTMLRRFRQAFPHRFQRFRSAET